MRSGGAMYPHEARDPCGDPAWSRARPQLLGGPASLPALESERARAAVQQAEQLLGRSIASSGVVGYRVVEDRVRPLVDAAVVRRSRAAANVELPRRADGFVTIEDRKSGLGIAVGVADAAALEVGVAGGNAVYDANGAARAWA